MLDGYARLSVDTLLARFEASLTGDATDHIPESYLAEVVPGGLAGARIGVVRSLFGAPGPVTATVDAALARMEAAGAVLVPVEIPGLPALLSGASAGRLLLFSSRVVGVT